mmetsp:Transcript_3665/g.11628  ORF Transcript_3665/g.11628 Transcript_3665/m.11628 type:complete len:218 (+) Transcript_3665:200-853(+)
MRRPHRSWTHSPHGWTAPLPEVVADFPGSPPSLLKKRYGTWRVPDQHSKTGWAHVPLPAAAEVLRHSEICTADSVTSAASPSAAPPSAQPAVAETAKYQEDSAPQPTPPPFLRTEAHRELSKLWDQPPRHPSDRRGLGYRLNNKARPPRSVAAVSPGPLLAPSLDSDGSLIYAYRDVIDTPKFTTPRHSLYVRDLRILREGGWWDWQAVWDINPYCQ